MRKPDDPLKLVIVRDMWLTGFDAPCLHTLYIDKPMKGHTLMQAIARVNRVYGDKPGGLIVDYLGIAADLKQALSFYADSGGTGDPAAAQEEAVFLLLEKLETVAQMLHGFNYGAYFTAGTARKLALILGAENHILGLEDGKKRWLFLMKRRQRSGMRWPFFRQSRPGWPNSPPTAPAAQMRAWKRLSGSSLTRL
jgi:type I restriction enzyme R subunit